MANSKSFVLFTENRDVFDALPDAECAALIRAIFQYEDEGTYPDMPGAAGYVFLMIKKDLDRNNEKYEKVKEARSMAGKKSAEARNKSKQNEQVLTNVNKDEQTATKATVNVNVNDNVSKEKEIKKKKAKTHCVDETEFEALWAVYPRKNGKAQAKKAYEKAVKDGATFDEVMAGILAYKEYIEAVGVEPQYIKMGSTFFHQRSWSDEWTIPEARAKPKSNVYTPEPPKYKVLEPDPVIDKTPMPQEIRDKLKGMFD